MAPLFCKVACAFSLPLAARARLSPRARSWSNGNTSTGWITVAERFAHKSMNPPTSTHDAQGILHRIASSLAEQSATLGSCVLRSRADWKTLFRAEADACQRPLSCYLGGAAACRLRVPMFSILSGGIGSNPSIYVSLNRTLDPA